MVILSNLSENLKELMAERSINQVTLAAALGTGRTKLSDIMNGKNAPSYATFLLLIEFFHCSADFLLGLSEEPREEVPYNPVPPFGECLRKMLESFFNFVGLQYNCYKVIMLTKEEVGAKQGSV